MKFERLSRKQIDLLTDNRRVMANKEPNGNEQLEDFVIRLKGSADYRSAYTLRNKGYGRVISIPPYDNGFFRPVKGLVKFAKHQSTLSTL